MLLTGKGANELEALPSGAPEPHGSVQVATARALETWLQALTAVPSLGALLTRSPEEQHRAGYASTLLEICQQPVTWQTTLATLGMALPALRQFVVQAGLRRDVGAVLLTGSGSSHYVGECLAPGLQAALRVPVRAVAAGELLTHPSGFLPSEGPSVVISFARSGESPESGAVLDLCLRRLPQARQVVFTCNAKGLLARRYAANPLVHTVVLDEATNDRSLVMTGSFTNLVLAGRALAAPHVEDYRRSGEALAERARHLMLTHGEALAQLGGHDFGRAMFLGDGGRFGAAREAGLKMLEMTAGRVLGLAETFLGLRHGPMSAVDAATVVVAFVSAEPVARAYEIDLLRELKRKRLGMATVLVGHRLPLDLHGPGVLVVDGPPADGAPADEDAPVLDVLVAQLLALFRCRALGLRPDAPSPDGVITRVVGPFAIHGRT
jgi:tagatose-6-phosphate ketose/aldose isomerase